MRTNVSSLFIVAAALVALAAPASAQSWSAGQTGASVGKARIHHRHTPHAANYGAWGAWDSNHQSSGTDCPNGDCRGLNSPGNMGGNHEF